MEPEVKLSEMQEANTYSEASKLPSEGNVLWARHIQQPGSNLNKGVVLCVEYNGDSACDVSYQTGYGESKTLTVQWGTVVGNKPKGSLFYLHVDDETNEVLVTSADPFPY